MSGGHDPTIVLVVAAAENGVIGAENGLPWRISSDMKRFKALTLGKPVIMGRKTFESIGKPLVERDNIVVTRNRALAAEGVIPAAGFDEALEIARQKAGERGVDEIAVIGGAEIFALALPVADRVALTVVHGNIDGDTHLPPFDPAIWAETARETCPRGERDSHETSFAILERRR